MATMYGGDDGTGKKKRKPIKIDGCWNGGQGKSCDKRIPNIAKKNKTAQPDEAPVRNTPAGTHMNVRDLGNSPGDVKPSVNGNTYTNDQRTAAMGAEKATTKARKKLKIYR